MVDPLLVLAGRATDVDWAPLAARDSEPLEVAPPELTGALLLVVGVGV